MAVERILGLDVGSVRIGVAISDPLCMFAQPLDVLDRRRCQPIAKIERLVAEYAVTTVVVGRPTRLAGDAGPAVLAVEAFVDTLRPSVHVPITWWDERLTTAAAERTMIDAGARRARRRARIDQVAAALILQSYMDAAQRSA